MRKSSIILCMLLAISTAAVAENANPVIIDLPTVAKLAIDRNLDIKASRQDVKTAQDVVQQAQGYTRGKVGIGAEYLHLNAPITISSPDVEFPPSLGAMLAGIGSKLGIELPSTLPSIAIPPTQAAPQDLLHLTVEGGYPLYTGGKIGYAIEQAKSGLSAREELAADTESSAVFDATQYYLANLLTQEVVNVNTQALASYKEHLAHAQKLYDSGVVAKYDLIRAQAAVKDQEKKLIEAQNRHDLAVAVLRMVLSIDDNTPIELRGNLFDANEPLTLQQAQAAAITKSSILKALDSKLNALKMAENIEAADGKPQVTAVAKAELLTGAIAQTDPKWLIGVEAKMNVFDGGIRNARIAEKKSEQNKALIERQSAEDKIKLAIRSAYLDLDSAKSALESAKKSDELFRESLRLATKRLDVGTGTSLEVLDANVALSAAQVSEYQSLYQIDLAYMKLHRYLNDISKVVMEAQQ